MIEEHSRRLTTYPARITTSFLSVPSGRLDAGIIVAPDFSIADVVTLWTVKIVFTRNEMSPVSNVLSDFGFTLLPK